MLVSGYWFLKVIILILSSIKHPVSAYSDINVHFQNFVIFGSGLSGLGVEELLEKIEVVSKPQIRLKSPAIIRRDFTS
jgi:hypothetical protein